MSAQSVDALGAVWDDFARRECAGYAPTYERICHGVARAPEILDVVRRAPPEAHIPNNLLAAVRFLLLGGTEHRLAAVYRGDAHDDAFVAFRDFVLSHQEPLLTVMERRRTQTNEIGRCAVLAPGLAEIQRRTGRSISLLDVGASAGLNLRFDDYSLDYRAVVAGPDGGPTVKCELHGAPPPVLDVTVDVAWRRGLDRSPVDVSSADDRRWLEACVWPDHPERAARLRAALGRAALDPPAILTGDAVDDLAAAASGAPESSGLVVMTSWAAAYLDVDRRRAFVDAIAALGRSVHWLAGEGPGVVPGLDAGDPPPRPGIAPSVLSLQAFVESEPSAPEQLAWVHPHGAWLEWVAH